MSKRRPHDYRSEQSYFAVVVGIVTNNQDPENLGRVKVKYPWLSATDESFWARLAFPMAGKERGWWFCPEVDDEVLIGFFHGDVHHPFVLGALWNGKDTTPDGLKNAEKTNDWRMFKSRSGHKMVFFDKNGEEYFQVYDKTLEDWWKIDTKNNNQVVNSDNGHLNHFAPKGQVTWEAKNIDIKVSGNVKMEIGKTAAVTAGTTMSIEGGPKMTWKGPKIHLNPPGATAGSAGAIKVSAGIAMDRVDSEAVEWAAYSAAAIKAAGEVTSAEPAAETTTPPTDPAEPEPPKALVNASWGSETVAMPSGGAAGSTVPISATVDNIPDGTPATLRVFDRAGALVATIEGTVSGGQVTGDWTPSLGADGLPEFIVEVEAGGQTSRSGVLTLTAFVDVTVRDRTERPLGGAEYELVTGDGKRLTGTTDDAGHFRHEDIYAGPVNVAKLTVAPDAPRAEPAEGGEFEETAEYRAGAEIPSAKTVKLIFDRDRALNNARWSREMIKIGESAQLFVDQLGLTGAEATAKIFLVLPEGDKEIGSVPATISGDTVQLDWSIAEFDDAIEPYTVPSKFKPEVYFVITADEKEARSPKMPVVDHFEFKVTDIDDEPVANVAYTLVLPDGTRRTGKTGADGVVREENVPHGKCGLIIDGEEMVILA